MRKGFPIELRHIGLPYQQETIRDGFPIAMRHIGLPYRQETIRPEISRLRFAPLEMTGRRDTIVLHTDRKLYTMVSYGNEAHWLAAPARKL